MKHSLSRPLLNPPVRGKQNPVREKIDTAKEFIEAKWLYST